MGFFRLNNRLVVLICLFFFSLNARTCFASSYQVHGSMAEKCEEKVTVTLTKTNGGKNEIGPSDWMKGVVDTTLIKDLSISGTHDSGTSVVRWIITFLARCQLLSIPEQLEKGIRYFDIRVRHDGLINHGSIACWKKLQMKHSRTIILKSCG